MPRSDFFPSPLYELSPYKGEGVRRLLGSQKNSKRKLGFTLFFLLPYGITAEYQPFKFFNHNYFEIVVKIISL